MTNLAYKTSADCAGAPVDAAHLFTGNADISSHEQSAVFPRTTDKTFSKAQIAVLVRNNIAAGDWDEYVHMRPCKGDDVRTRSEFLSDFRRSAERLMTHRMGHFFLWLGLGMMTISGIGAVVSSQKIQIYISML